MRLGGRGAERRGAEGRGAEGRGREEEPYSNMASKDAGSGEYGPLVCVNAGRRR